MWQKQASLRDAHHPDHQFLNQVWGLDWQHRNMPKNNIFLTAFFHSLKNVNSLLNFPAVNLCRIRWIKRFFLERFSKVTKGSAYRVEKFSRVMAPLGRTCLLLTDGKRHLFPHTWVSFSLTCNQFRHRKRKYLYGCPFFGLLRFLLPESFFLCADFLFGQYFEASLALFYATNSIAC